jgi:hypothetical protein
MSQYDKTDDSIVDNKKTKAYSKMILKKIRKNLYLDSRQPGSLPESMDQFPIDLFNLETVRTRNL